MSSDPTLLIGDNPGKTTEFNTTISNEKYLRLKHRTRYYGGHWDLTFFLSDTDIGSGLIDNYFSTWLMSQIGEYYGGAITWRGVVWELTRIKDGKRQTRSMSDVWNAVKCIYTSTGSNTQVETAYVTNSDSISRYLRREYIVYVDNISATQATAEATNFLNTHYDAWPVSTDFGVKSEDGLEITCLGMGRLFNNFFCTVTTPAGLVQVDTFVDDIWDTDLAPYLDFMSLGGIEANTLEVEREQRTPTRCGDLIDALARGGDGDIPYRWYVGSDLGFLFTKFSNEPTLEWRGLSKGGITKPGGGGVLWDAIPGVMEDVTTPAIPAIEGSFLQQRNHELIKQFSVWQGENQPTPETETPSEETLLSAAAKYQRMITDGNFDRLHTPGASPGYTGNR